MLHEVWRDPEDDSIGLLFAGPLGDPARARLSRKATLVWTVEGHSHFDVMTKYYQHQGWGVYTTDFPEHDHKTYAELGLE